MNFKVSIKNCMLLFQWQLEDFDFDILIDEISHKNILMTFDINL